MAILRTILALGQGLRFPVPAEGVETVDQVDILRLKDAKRRKDNSWEGQCRSRTKEWPVTPRRLTRSAPR